MTIRVRPEVETSVTSVLSKQILNPSNSSIPSTDSFIYDEKCVRYGYLSTDMAKMDAVASEPSSLLYKPLRDVTNWSAICTQITTYSIKPQITKYLLFPKKLFL